MIGRVDYDRSRFALSVCTNQLPFLQGGITRRPGTRYLDEVKDSTKSTRLVPFKFSTVSAFVLEFGDLYIRFKKDRVPIYDLTLAITGITLANPGVVTYTGTDPVNGDHVDISGIVGTTQLNSRRFRVSNVDTGLNTFELQTVASVNVDTTAFTAWASGGTAKRVYTLTSIYAAADLFQLKFKQSADVLYIWHPDYPESRLSRVTDSSWTIAATVFLDGPYLTVNTTTTTLQPAAATGLNIVLTASAVTGINDGAGFLASDVGRLIRIKEGSVWGWCRIVLYTSTTVVNVDIIATLTDATTKSEWRMGLYSETTGYPACGSFFGDRLYRGGCPEVPERVDGSVVGDYDNMAPSGLDGTVTDSSAVSFRLNSDDVQTIRWMSGTARGLSIGTFEGEWLLSPSQLNEAITPTNITAKQATSWGSDDVQAVRVGQGIMFVEAGGRRVRDMSYSYYENQFDASDVTILAEHITKGNYDPLDPLAGASTSALSGLVELAWQKKKIPTLWAPRYDGVLTSMAFDRESKIFGWQRQILGGWSNAGQTTRAKVESCCVTPVSDGSYDELTVLVQRYINGRSVRTIEYLDNMWEQGNAQSDAYYLDCGVTYSGVSTSTVTGLHHLAGETVKVLVDGATHADVVVSATGSISLAVAGVKVHVGYGYNSDGRTLRFDVGSAIGSAQAKVQRMHRVSFRLYETLGLQVGPDFDTLTEMNFRTTDDLMDVAVPLFTGDKLDDSWGGDYTSEALICWRWSDPLPGTILAIIPELVTQDRL